VLPASCRQIKLTRLIWSLLLFRQDSQDGLDAVEVQNDPSASLTPPIILHILFILSLFTPAR
jgi:hypothetical protein